MDRPILKNKIYLYLTEFFAGMSVMAVELGASRLLAPYFSSSQIVWTIIIGTIMIAMALGNLYGGKKSDKDPNPDKLYARIIVAAIWIAAIPVVGKYIIVLISGVLIVTISNNLLIIAAFLACMIIFVFPLFLLGTVTPSLVKFTVDSLEDSGSIVGRLNASNTIGSIIGTFVPTFISIPAVGTAITFLIFAAILIVLCIIYFFSAGLNIKRNKKIPVAIALFIVCAIFGHDASFAFWQDELTYEGESVYNYLQVYEDDSKVVLSTNVLFGTQSVYVKEEGPTGLYYDSAMASLYMAGVSQKSNLDVLILGNGSGTFSTQSKRYFDNLNVTGVEIDEKISDLAGEYFELSEDDRIITYDGRAYLNADNNKYDVIMVDAYKDITIPFQMSSQEFFMLVRDHLKDDGVMVVNMNMTSNEEGNISQYIEDTIASVFENVYVSDVEGTTNTELFASTDNEILNTLNKSVTKETNKDLIEMMSKVMGNISYYNGGDYILTDDRAPVELLGMRALDSIIKEELTYYKKVYKEEGIQGLLK